jgi:hypothetical protein
VKRKPAQGRAPVTVEMVLKSRFATTPLKRPSAGVMNRGTEVTPMRSGRILYKHVEWKSVDRSVLHIIAFNCIHQRILLDALGRL